MKLVLSTIFSTLTLFIFAFLFYWVVFSAGFMGSYLHIMRTPEGQIMWANIVGFLIQGFLLSVVYKYYYKGESSLKEGLIFGLLIGLLTSIPFLFFMWANYTLHWKAVLAEGAGMGFRLLVAGIVIGLTFGKRHKN